MSRSYFSLTTAPSGGRCSFPGSIAGVVFTGLCLGALPPDSLHAQAPEASTYPVDPAAAAGMTQGLPNGVTGRQAEMIQVRTSAQSARGEAAAALMARSADESIEQHNQEIALQQARERKSIKRSMTDRLQFERAAASYNKVSANDMSTWKTEGGGVRVERNVPDAFLMSLIEAEEEAAARAEASGEKKGFGLFRKDEDPDGGFLSFIRPPRLPFLGGGGGGLLGGGDEAEAAPVTSSGPPPSDTSEPSFARTGGSGSAPPQAAQGTPGMVPRISGAALVDGRSRVNPRETPASADRPPSQGRTVSFSDEIPETEKKRPGLFSFVKSQDEDENFSSLVPGGDGDRGRGGFFGFGKKKAAPEIGKIDAGLFPAGSAGGSSIGAETGETFASSASGGETFASASPDMVAPVSSSSSVELPGHTVEKSRGFSFPKPKLSLPTIPSLGSLGGGSGGDGGGNVPTMTTVNSSGSSYYVVASTAQFMVYGENRMQSEVRALPAGSVVLMTKPGEQWASVRLSNGTEGVVQNKHLRPASAAEIGGGFAPPAAAE